MLNYDNFAITLGRAIEAFRARPDAVDEHKRALRALVALTQIGAVALVRSDRELVVEGHRVAANLPGITTLLGQMDAHDVSEVRIAQRAAPAHLLRFLREMASGLGAFADGRSLGDRLRASGVTSVTIVSVPAAPEPAPEGRAPSVAETFESEAAARTLAEATSMPAPAPLADVIADLALDPARPDVLDRATAAAELVRRELEAGRVPAALASAAELVRLEGRLPESGPRRSLAIVLNRLLTRSMLQTAAEHSRDPAHEAAARLLIGRGGGEATEVLLERLVQAQTIGERRHYFDLLRQSGEGLRQVVLMLGHPEWFAVRNVAELLGELRVPEAVAPLARTLRHADPRVRRAAALALARIGTPDTLEHLGALLHDPDPELRYAVAAAIGGREMESLAMPLLMAVEREDDSRVAQEVYRALGRVGSAAALQALVRGVAPAGWRWWRRRPGRRLAAVEGLKVAGGPVAIGTLESLLEDKDHEVRRAAREALEDLDVL